PPLRVKVPPDIAIVPALIAPAIWLMPVDAEMEIVPGMLRLFCPEMLGVAPSTLLADSANVGFVIVSAPPVQLKCDGVPETSTVPTLSEPLDRFAVPALQSLSLPEMLADPPFTFITPLPPLTVALPPTYTFESDALPPLTISVP